MLAAFRSRNYRLFWCGSLVANLGLWVQQIALGWLVYDMTGLASSLGTVSFCGNLPVLVLGLVGGAIADRTSRRAIMLGTLLVIAASAASLAVLTWTGRLTMWHVIALAMMAGTASALYTPAMQAVIPSLVGEGDLLDAVSLNSVQFNLARAVGPALAGIAYDAVTPAGCFALNAVGFVALAVMLTRVRLPRNPVAAALPVGRALRAGLRYAQHHAVIWSALSLAAVMSVFGFPYIILLPALARDTLHLDAAGLGYLMAAVGSGAVTGGLGLALGRRVERTDRLALGSAVAFGLALTAFAVVCDARGIALLLFLMGGLQTVCVASLNTTIQLAVHDGMRGRVMSMMTVILFGFATAGALLIGVIADAGVGVPRALAGGGIVIALAATNTLRRGNAARA